MNSMADRFRKWYEYERDCNAKTLAMLESVPLDNRGSPDFQKAIDKMAHLVAARRRWLFRLGFSSEAPGLFPQGTALGDLTALNSETERNWQVYLDRIDDKELAREFDWEATDGHRYRWNIEGVLTQVFGHAWYHRGQIALLVSMLGGEAVDTDYIFWCRLPQIAAPSKQI